MNIKDFTVGQTVYMLPARRYAMGTPVTVSKVGRVYVTIDRGRPAAKFCDTGEGKEYLVEQAEIGSPAKLFPTKIALEAYLEKEEIKKWISRATDWSKLNCYTLDQLRRVKEALSSNIT